MTAQRPTLPTFAPMVHRLSRRQAIVTVVIGSLATVLSGCGGAGQSAPKAINVSSDERAAALANGGSASQSAPKVTDFSRQFAAYQVAAEPNGDLAKVVWPDFVTQAGPEVQRLYKFQVLNGDLMRYMPCFCGCWRDGHQNNRDCYVKDVNPDGSVVFDPMAPT